MNMRFHKYYFENFSPDTPFDLHNPRYVLSQAGVDSILERIAVCKPYSLKAEDFANRNLITAMLHIDVLQEKAGKLAMAVPFFTAKDTSILKELSQDAAKRIASELLSRKAQIVQQVQRIKNGYCVERNLYHVLCAALFDGLLFDYLEEHELVTTSRLHKSGLDYLVILYEDTPSLNAYSDMLLCSYNRLMANGKGFVSFGDSQGNRHDFYRYYRQLELNLLPDQERIYGTYPVESLIENFDSLAHGKDVPAEYVSIYEHFGYCQNGKIDVPIYDAHSYEITKQLYHLVIPFLAPHLANALALLQQEVRLTAVSHGVAVKDIANEIYHLIFGEVNELLVQRGFVSAPPHYPGEGRYFKSFER